MIKIMTKEEEISLEEKLDEFLISLDFNTKSALVRLLTPFLEQLKCEHEWIDPNEYKNKLDKTKLFCRKCNLTKPL